MYGADVLIFEGILAFHRPEINKMMDMKVGFTKKKLHNCFALNYEILLKPIYSRFSLTLTETCACRED